MSGILPLRKESRKKQRPGSGRGKDHGTMSSMKDMSELQEYMTKGVERIVSEAVRATLKDPRESAFMLRFAAASKAASKKRRQLEKEGEHVPAFLLASITSSCNLHCAGCYSRCNQATVDEEPVQQLSGEEWEDVFCQAEELGISFILLLGGEPLLRRDVLEAAGKKSSILFPVFTNGTYMGERYFRLFEQCRNLLPVMSIEGGREATDLRRGEGVYDRLMSNMQELQRRHLIYGASVTVTTENVREVTTEEFLLDLAARGCKVVFFVEYVPMDGASMPLAPGEEEREYLAQRIDLLRHRLEELVLISFPGDEKSSGGCIAAGRGFFHINSHGDAEPCPASPYSDCSVRDGSLRDALHSRLFQRLREEHILEEDHRGGCVLHEKRETVERMAEGQAACAEGTI